MKVLELNCVWNMGEKVDASGKMKILGAEKFVTLKKMDIALERLLIKIKKILELNILI